MQISKLLMRLQESCSTISLAKLKKSLTAYLLVVNGYKIGTTKLATLYVCVYKADKTGWKGRQPSTHFIYTLQQPYIIPGPVPTNFRCLCVYLDMLLESRSFL